jgi:hypothetical protein
VADPIPQSVINMDPNFETRLSELRDRASNESTARQVGEQVVWDRPSDWAGTVFDYESYTKSFDRTSADQDCVDAIKDPANPGVVGDLVAGTLMIDTLACMQRAFRNRYTMRRCRAVAHMAGRKKGHGSATGVYGQNGIEYLRQVMIQAKVPL